MYIAQVSRPVDHILLLAQCSCCRFCEDGAHFSASLDDTAILQYSFEDELALLRRMGFNEANFAAMVSELHLIFSCNSSQLSTSSQIVIVLVLCFKLLSIKRYLNRRLQTDIVFLSLLSFPLCLTVSSFFG